MTGPQLQPGELLLGARAIGVFLGLEPSQVWHLARKGHLPVIRIGAKMAVRRSRLVEWLARQEEAAEVKTDGA